MVNELRGVRSGERRGQAIGLETGVEVLNHFLKVMRGRAVLLEGNSPFLVIFAMETTNTGIVYLDMHQQFLIPHLGEDDQERHIHFQQGGTLPHHLGEAREQLTPVSEVGGLVERRR
jgi:hypothetical protein